MQLDSWGYSEFKAKKNNKCSKGKVLQYVKCGEGACALVVDTYSNKKLWRFRSLGYYSIELPADHFSSMLEFFKYVDRNKIEDLYCELT